MKLRSSILFGVSIGLGWLFSAHGVFAATIFFSPSGGTYHVGDSVNVSVVVSSADQALNAVSGDVVFPGDLLEATGVSKSGSIISLWVQNPSFSNSTHRVHFEGIALNPGYTGSGGRVLTMTFRVKAEGQANLRFSGVSILANDGQGTGILSGSGSAQYHLVGAAEHPASPTPEAPSKVNQVPVIHSSTYPQSSRWYAERNGAFQWSLPSDVTGVNWSVSRSPSSVPSTSSQGRASDALVKTDGDGIWYFHARFQTPEGWGATAHYRFQVDTTKPDRFEIKALPRPDSTQPSFSATFEATDTGSGIDNYRVKLDEEAEMVWQDPGSHTFETNVSTPGAHQLIATAYDRAGNTLSAKISWEVSTIAPPTINEYVPKLPIGSWIVVKGISFPRATVTVFQQRTGTQEILHQSITTNDDGRWVYVSNEKMPVGVYQIWATVTDTRGAQSSASTIVSIQIQHTLLWFMGSAVVNPWLIWILLLILLILIFTGSMYHHYSVRRLERHLLGMMRDSQMSFQKHVGNLKKDAAKSRNRKLLQDLEEAEEVVKKKLKDLDT